MFYFYGKGKNGNMKCKERSCLAIFNYKLVMLMMVQRRCR